MFFLLRLRLEIVIVLLFETPHGIDINENNNFKNKKLFMHGYKILHEGDSNENEKFKKNMHGWNWERS